MRPLDGTFTILHIIPHLGGNRLGAIFCELNAGGLLNAVGLPCIATGLGSVSGFSTQAIGHAIKQQGKVSANTAV